MADQLLEKIAEEAGVSVRTVYRILNGAVIQKSRPNIARRAEMIREIATRLNYRPNTAAKAVSTGRFNCVSLLVSESPKYGYMHHDLLRGIMYVMNSHKMQFAMSSISDRDLSSKDRMPSLLNHMMADGMMINYSHHHPAGMRNLIATQGIPTVWINSDLPQNCVRPDDVQGGRLAVEAALEHGCRKICFLQYNYTYYNNKNNPPDPAEVHFSHGHRLHGYRLQMQEAGMQPISVELTGMRYSDALPIVTQWMEEVEMPDAVITSHPAVALALHTAATRHGLKMPEDLLIITFQGNLPHDELNGEILSMLIPWFETGRVASEKTLQLIGDSEDFPVVGVPYDKPVRAADRDMYYPSLIDGDEAREKLPE